mmetsp:Transcript_8107/g.23260  ORF Transcript_8107/g.23260 Transcript_8107/m.23260 type:complete len:100 (+) Transcript_8107:165-464(+)
MATFNAFYKDALTNRSHRTQIDDFMGFDVHAVMRVDLQPANKSFRALIQVGLHKELQGQVDTRPQSRAHNRGPSSMNNPSSLISSKHRRRAKLNFQVFS